MKFLQPLLALSALASSSPLPPSPDASTESVTLLGVEHLGNVDLQSANDADLALQTLEKRLNKAQCKAIGRTLLKIGTSSAMYVSHKQQELCGSLETDSPF